MKPLLTSILAAACLLAPAAEATTIGGITVPQTRDELKLHGAGLLRKGFLFRIYVGALYVEQPGHTREILGPVPKRIDIHYFHHTPRRYMVRAADEALRKNLSELQYSQFAPQLEKLHNAYLNGRKGSCASLVYRPGEGLTYLFDDRAVVTIDDDEFANAYFKVWLGEIPSSRTIKRAMLDNGGRQGHER
jgi:hypothetical protein